MKIITAELLTIGDELLYGQIVDTNSQWMSAELSGAGIKVIRKTTVGDVEEEILKAFREAEDRSDIVLITGGLGPTSDDLTKPCLAKYFDCDLRLHEDTLVRGSGRRRVGRGHVQLQGLGLATGHRQRRNLQQPQVAGAQRNAEGQH